MRENRGLAATLSALLLLSLACGVGGGTAAWIYQRIAWENARLADDAHRLSRQLRQERDIRQRALADMYASFGLQQAEQGEPQEALSWFVQAAAASPEGSRQRQTNEVRMQTWYRQLARPVSLLPGGFALRRLRFHPDQRCLLAIPYNRRQPDRIWDWDAERVWPWPQECGSVTALDWTPDGERVALGNAAGEIWWCPFPAGSPVRHREGSERISTLVWDPAGQRLAVAAGTKVWIDVEPATSTEGTEPVTFEHAIDHLCFSPDGQYLLVTTDDRQVHVLNGTLEPPRPLWSAEVDWSAGWVKPQPQFTADSTQVILVRPGNRLSWFSLADGTLVREVPTSTVNDAAPYELRTSADRSRLAVACLDQGVRVFATDDGRPLASLPHHGDMAVCFGRTPDQLLTAGANRKAMAWSLAGEPRGETQTLHSTGFLCVEYSTDYQFLATCGYDHRITVWQLPPHPQHTVTPFPSSGQVRGWFTPRGGRLYLRQEGAGVSVVDSASRQPVAGPWRSSGHLLEACSSRDDRRLACLSLVDDQTLQVDIYPVADPAARGVSQQLPAKPRYLPADGWYGADQIQWTADGRRCVVLALDQLFALDAATGRIAWEQKIHGVSDHVCLSPRGDQLVNYSAGGMEVRDTVDGSRQFQLPFRALSAAITTAPRGVTLAAGGWDGVIRFWDLETGQALPQEIPHPSWIEQLEFSDDGQYLVSCCKDHGVRVWDRARLQLAGPPIFAGEPCITRLSPDARWLATATAAGRIDIWDWREGRRVCPSYRLDSSMLSQIFSQARNLQWSRQGRRLFCGGRHGEAVVLDVEIESIGLPALLQPQREWAQVLAMARMGEESRLIPLSSDEWRSCWQSLRTQGLEFLPVRRGDR
ncbi:MAG: WD40 repeat domain-containing protein [Pirellulales bacterium]